MKYFFWANLMILSVAFAEAATAEQPQIVSTEEVARQLQDAEKEFQEAKKMFNPWYAGPLLTPGAHILPPNNYNIQPYLFYTTNYAKFNQSGSTKNISNLKQLNPSVVFQFGLLSWLDGSINVQSITNWQYGKSRTNFGDSSINLGFGVLDESLYTPAVLINIKESIPTGKYKNLSSTLNGIDSTGAGVFSTQVSLNVAKVVWWVLTHPMNLRASFGYTFPSIAKVNGFNTYGGGFGTKGKIHTPNEVSIDAAVEYSFTQRWVFAVDAVYNYSGRTRFVGKAGHNADGTLASNGGPFSDNLSFAPAIEYNPNSNLGILAGVWFSVWGRNTYDFVSGVVSVTYTF